MSCHFWSLKLQIKLKLCFYIHILTNPISKHLISFKLFSAFYNLFFHFAILDDFVIFDRIDIHFACLLHTFQKTNNEIYHCVECVLDSRASPAVDTLAAIYLLSFLQAQAPLGYSNAIYRTFLLCPRCASVIFFSAELSIAQQRNSESND